MAHLTDSGCGRDARAADPAPRDGGLIAGVDADPCALLLDHRTRASALLTPGRRELLRALRDRPESSLTDLAAATARAYGNVHEDVSILQMAGMIEGSSDALRLVPGGLSLVVEI